MAAKLTTSMRKPSSLASEDYVMDDHDFLRNDLSRKFGTSDEGTLDPQEDVKPSAMPANPHKTAPKRKVDEVVFHQYLGLDDGLCRAPLGQATWCAHLEHSCPFKNHGANGVLTGAALKRALMKRYPLEPGVYLKKRGGHQVYLAPVIPLAVAASCDTFLGVQSNFFEKQQAMTLVRAVMKEHEESLALSQGTDPLATPTKHKSSSATAVLDTMLRHPYGTHTKKLRFTAGEQMVHGEADPHLQAMASTLDDNFAATEHNINVALADLRGLESGMGEVPDGHTTVWTALATLDDRMTTQEAADRSVDAGRFEALEGKFVTVEATATAATVEAANAAATLRGRTNGFLHAPTAFFLFVLRGVSLLSICPHRPCGCLWRNRWDSRCRKSAARRGISSPP